MNGKQKNRKTKIKHCSFEKGNKINKTLKGDYPPPQKKARQKSPVFEYKSRYNYALLPCGCHN